MMNSAGNGENGVTQQSHHQQIQQPDSPALVTESTGTSASAASAQESSATVDLLNHPFHSSSKGAENSSCSSPASTIEVDIEKSHKYSIVQHHQHHPGVGTKSSAIDKHNPIGNEADEEGGSPTTNMRSSLSDEGLFYATSAGVDQQQMTDSNNNDHVINQNEDPRKEKLIRTTGSPNAICEQVGS